LLRLFLWELAVAVGGFGWGAAGLRCLGVRRRPLALNGIFGVAIFLALGGWMNLVHLLSPAGMGGLVGCGVLLAAYSVLKRDRREVKAASAEPWDLPSIIVVGVAVLILGTLMLGTLRPLAWCVDDTQAYIAFAQKAFQNHSLQSDPFSDRRVSSGIGGGIFLDSLMLVGGSLRGLKFIDETFGQFLYAACLWTIGRMWRVPRWAVGLALIGIPFATLIQVNLTIVYLTSASCLAILILLSGLSAGGEDRRGTLVAVGILAGASLTTKSTNVVFVVPFCLAAIVLGKLLERGTKVLKPVAITSLTAGIVVLPWSIAQKFNEGTYLYPLLGKGFHASAYHLVPSPSGSGSIATAVVVAGPIFLIMVGCVAAIWMLTSSWPAGTRAALVGFAGAAALAAVAIGVSTGGEAVDRYSAPFTMPPLLLLLMLLIQTWRGKAVRAARYVGAAVLLAGIFFAVRFIDRRLGFFRQEMLLADEAVGRVPEPLAPYLIAADEDALKRQEARELASQAAIPAGATVLADIRSSYGFDFRRNKIYICDWCGMAGLPPGMPIDGGAEALRRYLVSAGISYVICDKGRYPTQDFWPEYERQPYIRLTVSQLLHDQSHAHQVEPWGRMQTNVMLHISRQLSEVADQSPVVYDDGTLVVARIDGGR
jgi:hypothetical protein